MSLNKSEDWKKQVVYQIYPRSFCDSNGDGVGDLPGITSKLDYLNDLGVGVVWLSPIYASPQDDNGYDISDYCSIAPEFGTMADFDAMLDGMHRRGMKLMMDLVVNHTSDEHPWFVQARSSRDNPFHDFYIWREPNADGSPPTNWEAAFQGSVWEWNEPTGEYYLHMFSVKQPDLNWENPAVRQEVYALMRFWLDKGVDGFRMDVINMISKPWNADGSLPDAPVVADDRFLQPSFGMVCNGPRLYAFLREMREQVLDHYDTITVGETPLATVEQGRAITHPQTGSLDMLFQFEHMDLDSVGGSVGGKWDLKPLDWRDMKRTMARWQDALAGQGWNSLYLNNHDQPRPVSRYGAEGQWREKSAKMLGLWLHGMQGTPYVYQGEELGMTNVYWDDIHAYRDLEILNFYHVATTERGWTHEQVMASVHAKGRDNARVPMMWTDGPTGGFTAGTPWIGCHPDVAEQNAARAVANPDSVYHFYRQLIGLRQHWRVLVDGVFADRLPDDPNVGLYTRTNDAHTLMVVTNLTHQPQTMAMPLALAGESWQCLLHNHSSPPQMGATLTLAPFDAAMWVCSHAH